MADDSALVSDLAQLRALGELDMMNFARYYIKLNDEVANVLSTDTNPFAPMPTAGGNDRVYGPWCEVRGQLVNFLGHSALSFESASRAILHIVELYANADADNADDIRAAWQDTERTSVHEKPVHNLAAPIFEKT